MHKLTKPVKSEIKLWVDLLTYMCNFIFTTSVSSMFLSTM